MHVSVALLVSGLLGLAPPSPSCALLRVLGREIMIGFLVIFSQPFQRLPSSRPTSPKDQSGCAALISARVALPKKMNAELLPFGAFGSFFFLAFFAGFLVDSSSSALRFFCEGVAWRTTGGADTTCDTCNGRRASTFFFFFSGDGLLAFFCEGGYS